MTIEDRAAGVPNNDKATARHELAQFLDQDQSELASEYQRIYSRSTEDPGTAGDEGENNWARLLCSWLPEYQVATKGRVLFPNGDASPQVDLLILASSYPQRLLEKKLYLSSGVIAAFECKNTLKSEHVKSAFETARFLKQRTRREMGSTQTELTKPPVFGLLAHSSTWKSPSSTPIDNVDLAVQAALDTPDVAPWDPLDIVCIGDVAAWTLSHFIEAPSLFAPDLWQLRVNRGIDPTGRIGTQYTRWKAGQFGDGPAPNPIAILVAHLLERFAWSDGGLRPMADYFRVTGLLGQGAGPARSYPLHALSDKALRELENHRADWAGSWCLDRMVIGT